MTEREEKIITLIAMHLNIDPSTIGPNDALQTDLGADSLDVVEIIMAVEQAFQLPDEIPDDEVAAIVTVGDTFKLIESKIS